MYVSMSVCNFVYCSVFVYEGTVVVSVSFLMCNYYVFIVLLFGLFNLLIAIFRRKRDRALPF